MNKLIKMMQVPGLALATETSEGFFEFATAPAMETIEPNASDFRQNHLATGQIIFQVRDN